MRRTSVTSARLMATAARAASLLCLSVALCMVAMPAAAQAEAEAVADEPLVAAIDVELSAEVWPAAAAPPLPRPSAGGSAGEVIDYRLWLGSERAAVGFGMAAAPMRELAGPWAAHGSSTVVGMRVRLSETSRVYFDSASLAEPPLRDLRMGFEFKSAPNTALGLARGTLFRVQWNSHSHVSLRLRGGKLAIALRSQF
jgi:hypothetical protein